jgi:hypothetical protein
MPILSSIANASRALKGKFVFLNYTSFSTFQNDGIAYFGAPYEPQIINNYIYLTRLNFGNAATVYFKNSRNFDRSFSLSCNIEASGATVEADGFCIQWTATNNSYGTGGSNAGRIADAATIHAISFRTYQTDSIVWHKNNVQQATATPAIGIGTNLYVWLDYVHETQTAYLYYSTTSTKPGSAQQTYTSFVFDTGSYYFSIGAGSGTYSDNQFVKTINLTFN